MSSHTLDLAKCAKYSDHDRIRIDPEGCKGSVRKMAKSLHELSYRRTICKTLFRAATSEKYLDGFEKNSQVQQDRQVLDVKEIIL